MENRNEVFQKFLEENPTLANPENHHRRLADWAYDTKYRNKVASGEMSFQEALNASLHDAIKTLPPAHEQTQSIEGLTGYDADIARMAIGRNQPIPTQPERSNESGGVVARICAQNAGFRQGEPEHE